MKPHESPGIRKKSICGDSGDSWPVWNRDIKDIATSSFAGVCDLDPKVKGQIIYYLVNASPLNIGRSNFNFASA